MRRDPSSLRSVGMTGTRVLFSVLCYLHSVICTLFSVLYSLYSILCTLFQELPCIAKIYVQAVIVRLPGIEVFIVDKVYSV